LPDIRLGLGAAPDDDCNSIKLINITDDFIETAKPNVCVHSLSPTFYTANLSKYKTFLCTSFRDTFPVRNYLEKAQDFGGAVGVNACRCSERIWAGVLQPQH